MIEVKAQAQGRAEILVYGPISEGFFEETGTARKVDQELAALGEVTDITVRINSPGGNLFEGVAVFNMLKRHPAQVHTQVDGLAASAASLIAMAGDMITMGQGAMMMVHDPHTLAVGNAEAMRETADMLDKVADSMASAYAERTGKSEEEARAIMRAETWMTASEAVEMGFADEVFGESREDEPEDDEDVNAAWAGILGVFNKTPSVVYAMVSTPHSAEPTQSAPAGAASLEDDMTTANASVKDADKIHAEAVKAERNRVSEITSLCDKHGMDAEFRGACIRDGIDALAAGKRILEAKYEATKGLPPNGGVSVSVGADESEKRIEAASEWLVMRAGIKKYDSANPYRGMTIENIARDVLEHNGVRTMGMGREAIIKAAITHSTSDFPNIFENALHKTMLGAFEVAAPIWNRVARTSSLSDFRPHIRYRPGSFSDLLPVAENGEYLDGTMGDAQRETIQAIRKGRILNVSREMLINDDMSVFTDVATYLGQAAARAPDKDLIALLASNGPTMSDGNPLFHASHGNIAGTAATPTIDAFEAARVLMAEQTDPSGNDFLDIRPAIWLGPMSIGGQARSTNAAEYNDESQKNQRRPNVSRGLVRDIVDTARLSGTTAWYLIADPAVAPTFEVGFLDGVQVPQLEMDESFRSDGIAWRIRYEYGVAAIDWRGIVRNAGT